ncbi:MAG: SsrA-binding protein SmpB [Phycisphaerae bacterium]|jgi:SsrA-binding protein
MAKKATPDNIVCRNRKAMHRFQVLERLECGMVLVGTEVKSLRDRNASIEEAYARIEGGELWLIGSHIAPYRFGHDFNHDPYRRRKLLAHARQIEKLKSRVELKGLTLIPLKIYFNDRGVAKLSLGLAQGKRAADKRESLKARDHKREIERAMRRKR